MRNGIKFSDFLFGRESLSAVFFVTTCLVLLAGCRENAADNTNSETKNLDNLTGASSSLTAAECGLKMSKERFEALSANDKKKLERVIAPTEDLKRQVAGALVSVPLPLQRLFFSANGRIRVTPDAENLCNTAGLSEGDKAAAAGGAAKVKSCWLEKGGLQIVLQDNPAEIQHNLLRMFAFLYTEFLTNKLAAAANLPADAMKVVTIGTARLETQKKLIAAALIQDVKNKVPASLAKINALASSNASAFGNYAVAEAVDSYYCSAATNQRFKNSYPATYQIFVGNPALSSDFGQAWHERSAK